MKSYYVAPSIYLHKKGELGTFASRNLPEEFDLGCAIDIPMGKTRPSLEWTRTEICKMTNHSFESNLKQISHRNALGVMVHYVTSKPIKKGEELLVNYKEFDFHKLIDMSFLDPDAGHHLLYYRIDPSMLKFYKKFGLSSPKRISELKGVPSGILDDFFDYDQFNNHDSNSSTIIFSMFPLSEYHPTYMRSCIEFEIDTLKLDGFIPVILIRNKYKNITYDWDTFRTDNNYDGLKHLVINPSVARHDPIVVAIKDAFHIDLELCERTYRKYDEKGNFKHVPIRR